MYSRKQRSSIFEPMLYSLGVNGCGVVSGRIASAINTSYIAHAQHSGKFNVMVQNNALMIIIAQIDWRGDRVEKFKLSRGQAVLCPANPTNYAW